MTVAALLKAPAIEMPVRGRLLSLDLFRGLTVALMLVVNNLALGQYTPDTLRHADWSGAMHVADLVFPWFLLAMGLAVGLSSRPAPLGKVCRRVVTLLLLGMLIDTAVNRRLVLGLGVLQLIGLAYGVASLAARLPALARFGLAAALLAVHTALLWLLPLPNVPPGTVTEGANAVLVINGWLNPYGLRGLPSLLTTGALAILAALVGERLRDRSSERVLQVLGAGALMALVGVGLATSLPMLKPIWTASYVLVAGGLGVMFVGALAAIEGLPGVAAAGWPFLALGSSAILAYVGPVLLKVVALEEWRLGYGPRAGETIADAALGSAQGRFGPVGGPLVYLACYIGFWTLVCAYLKWKNIHVRV